MLAAKVAVGMAGAVAGKATAVVTTAATAMAAAAWAGRAKGAAAMAAVMEAAVLAVARVARVARVAARTTSEVGSEALASNHVGARLAMVAAHAAGARGTLAVFAVRRRRPSYPQEEKCPGNCPRAIAACPGLR